MKMYGGVEGELHAFLISALDRGECSASLLGRFNQEERATDIHWIWGCVGPRLGLDAVAKRKDISASAGNRNEVNQPVT
jgi:hypothetical protein